MKQGHGDRIDEKANPDLFTGLFWSGDQAKGLGLIDGFGSVRSIAREELGAETVVDFTLEADLFEQFSKQLGAALRFKMSDMQNAVLR